MCNHNFKIIVSISLLLVLLITPGCWDNRDFSKIVFVAAMGIDKTKDNGIELTLQIIKPQSYKSDQGEKSNSQNSVWVESFTGKTVMDAVRNALSTTNRQPNYSQVLILVIGEDLAKEGIMEALDLCARDHEIQKKIRVLIAKGSTAKKILSLGSSLEAIPAVHISEVLDNEAASPIRRKVELFDVLKDLGSPGINPTIGVIEPPDQGNMLKDVRVNGVAAFKLDKLVGYLNPEQTMGLLFVLNKIKGGVLNIPHPFNPSKQMTIEIKSSKTDIEVTGYDNQPILKIKVNLQGNIADAEGVPGVLNKEKAEVIEQEAAAKVKEIIEDAIKTSQQDLKSDIFGFGKYIWQKDPQSWAVIKDHWDDDFSQAQLEIEVKAKVKTPGLIMKSVEPQ